MENLQTQLQDETALIGALVDIADSPAVAEPEPELPVVQVGEAQVVEVDGPAVPIDAAKEWTLHQRRIKQQEIIQWTILLRQANLRSLSYAADRLAAHQHAQEADLAGPWMVPKDDPQTRTHTASGQVALVPRVYKPRLYLRPESAALKRRF